MCLDYWRGLLGCLIFGPYLFGYVFGLRFVGKGEDAGLGYLAHYCAEQKAQSGEMLEF